MRENPYLLCDFPINVPFNQADDAAASLGLDPESEFRRRAGILHVLRHNLNNGHTCLPTEKLIDITAQFFVLTELQPQTYYLLCGRNSYYQRMLLK